MEYELVVGHAAVLDVDAGEGDVLAVDEEDEDAEEGHGAGQQTQAEDAPHLQVEALDEVTPQERPSAPRRDRHETCNERRRNERCLI